MTVDSRHSISTWLAQRYGASDLVDAATSLAEKHSLLTRPVRVKDLVALAAKRGVMLIADDARIYDGSLLVIKGGFEIRVNSNPRGSMAFTIAHEIGHTYFYEHVGEEPRRVGPIADAHAEEAFCDRFAAELLLPSACLTPWIQRIALEQDAGVSAAAIIDIAAKFRLAISEVALRLSAQLAVIPGLIVGFEWDAHVSGAAWIPKWYVASESDLVWCDESMYERSTLQHVLSLEKAYRDSLPVFGAAIELAELEASLPAYLTRDLFSSNASFCAVPRVPIPIQLPITANPRETEESIRDSTELLLVIQ